MKDYLFIFVYILLLVASAAAQDVTRLEKIGDVAGVRRDDSSVILNCTDNSQVRITVLAPGFNSRSRVVFKTTSE